MEKFEFLELEELKALFFDEDALLTQPEPIYRLNSSGQRYYYDFDPNGEPRFYTSVTTLIQNTLPTSPHLIKWIADKGYDESKEFTKERANYGTFMHIQIAELLIEGHYDLDLLKDKLKSYIEEEKLPASLISWEEDLKKDILAFAQFIIDHNVKPLAIEIILTNPDYGYAGAIDLVCEMDISVKGYWGELYKTGVKAGQPKETTKTVRTRAIVDFKSGKKGFFESHEIQLHAYMAMWEKHFEEFPVDKVFNWSPKDWRSKPTYNLKDQTGSKNAQKLDYLVQLNAIEQEKRIGNIIVVGGLIEPKRGLENNISAMTLSEIVKNNNEVKNKPTNEELLYEINDEPTIDQLMEEKHKNDLL